MPCALHHDAMPDWTQLLLRVIFGWHQERHVCQHVASIREAMELNRHLSLCHSDSTSSRRYYQPPTWQPPAVERQAPEAPAQQQQQHHHHLLHNQPASYQPLPWLGCASMLDILDEPSPRAPLSTASSSPSECPLPAAQHCPEVLQLTPNPLYRCGSSDQPLDNQHTTHQQHQHQHHQQPHQSTPSHASMAPGTTAAEGPDARSSSASGAATPGQLACALVDANERVCAARGQLAAARADINMLLGVIESQQQLLRAATQAQQDLALLLAQERAASCTGSDSTHTSHPACQPHQGWPGAASGCCSSCSGSRWLSQASGHSGSSALRHSGSSPRTEPQSM